MIRWAESAARNSPSAPKYHGQRVLDVDDFADRGRSHLIRSAMPDVGRRRRVLEQIPQGRDRGLSPRQITLQALQMRRDKIVARLNVGR